jgi:hypothetical protein
MVSANLSLVLGEEWSCGRVITDLIQVRLRIRGLDRVFRGGFIVFSWVGIRGVRTFEII